MRYELTLNDSDKDRAPLPTTEYVTVCDAIEPDTRQWDGVSQIADRYAVPEHR